MMKRTLAFCLALVMVIGMLPTVAFAEETDVPVTHLAYYAGNVTVDNAITETEWYLYGKITDGTNTRAFDVLWDESNLYLAIDGQNGDIVAIESGEYTDSIALTGAAELSIPLTELGGTVKNYGQTIPLTLTIGTMTWSGDVILSSAQRSHTITGWGLSHKDSTTMLKTAILADGGLNISRKYGSGTTTTAYDAAIYKIMTDQTYPTTDNLEMTSLEFDFRCDSMPEYNSLGYLSGSYAARGFALSYTDGVNNDSTSKPDCVNFGITNSNGTLYALIGFGLSNKTVAAVSTGKTLGETFHVQLLTTADRAVEIYIDGALIRKVDNGIIDTYPLGGSNTTSIPVIRLGNYGNPEVDGMKADGSDDVDFTIWNVTMGETCGSSVMDTLTWDTIRGENIAQDAVSSALNLVTSLNNPHFENTALTWTSSDDSVIRASDGQVFPALETKTVTLTAALASAPEVTKDFEITVPAKTMVATLITEEIVIDGVLSEGSWASAGVREFTVFDGMTAQKAYALWDSENMYFAIEGANINQVKVDINDMMGGATVGSSASIAEADGVLEVVIPWSSFAIDLQDYNEVYPFNLTVSDADGNSASLEADLIDFVFSGKYITAVTSVLDMTTTAIGGCAGSYNAAEGAWVQTSTGSADYWIKTGVPAITDHSLDIMAEIDLQIAALPEGGEGSYSGAHSAKGVYLWMSPLTELTNEGKTTNGYYTFANIYNAGSGALKLQLGNLTPIALGKNVGDRFLLGYCWHPDDTVTVYVDGTEVDTIGPFTKYLAGSGEDVLQIRTTSPVSGQQATTKIYSAKVTASGMGTASLEEELSKANVLEGIDLTDLTDDSVITLPGTWETMLGTFELSWESANTDAVQVVDNGDGTWTLTAKQPAKTVSTYVDVTMTGNGREFWSVEASVKGLGADAETTASTLRVPFTAAEMVIDGSTTDEGWSFDIKTIKSGVSTGRFGAQWNTENLFFALDTKGNSNLAITVDGKALDLSKAAKSGNIVELAVTLESLGIELADYNYTMDVAVTIGNATWEGELILTSTDWFITDGVEPRLVIPTKGTTKLGTDLPTSNQGYEDIGNGWRLFDLYNPTGSNPTRIRTYLLAWGRDGTDEDKAFYAPLNDRTEATYVEFDFLAKSMPEYVAGNGNNGASDWSSLFSNYGLTWNVSAAADENKYSTSVSMGIYNSAEGLVLCVMGTQSTHLLLNKQVGEQFRLGTRWNPDGSLDVYVDGVFVERVYGAESEKSAYGDNSFIFNLIRNATPAASGADSFDIYLTNISIGKNRGESLFESLTIDDILGENTDPYAVTENLVIPESIYDNQLNITADLQWTISDPSVVAADGTITRPENGGKLVTLTATWEGHTREFEVYVKGMNYTSNTMVVFNDLDTAYGAGKLYDSYYFTLDTTNNSIVYDQGSSKAFNLITLTDGDNSNRLNESCLTIWVSNDNKTYTKVDSFKIKNTGNKIYLYDFQAEGRYVKVHCTQYLGTEADFTGAQEQMLAVEWNDSLDINSENFTASATRVFDAGETMIYDAVWPIASAYASHANEDKSDVRFVLNSTGEILYHYWDGTNYQVRVPAAQGTVGLTILSGYEGALDISNKEYALEVVYGTRETRVYDGAGRWVVELPDGRTMAIQGKYDEALDENWLSYCFSYNGGMTWTEPIEIEGTRGWLHSPGGVTYDPNNGRIIVEGYQYVQFVANDMASSDCKLRFVYSDDLGKTWTRSPEVTFDGEEATYVLSYSDPVIVSSYDGEDGPNIDMILNNGVQYGDDGTFCCRVAYSTDAGKSWTLGADKIRFSPGEGLHHHEGGVSEATILEVKDENGNGTGKLVLYARCQFDSVDVFCKAYSYDYGKTWTTEAELSDMYTVNTQPIMHEFGDAQLMFWGGNNVLGGNSYQRMPMNVAISYDDMETFVNIQDLYARYSLQGMTTATRNQIINQSVSNQGDTVTLVWDNNFKESLIMRIDNFTDWFYRTNGAWDSFETSTTKAEGWSTTSGSVYSDDTQAKDGSYSMKLNASGGAVRTVPYLQNGTVSFDLYLLDDPEFQIELESAYGVDYGRAAPIGFVVENGTLTFLGGTSALPVVLNAHSWNNFTFKLDLDAEQPVAELYINGAKFADAPVNTDIGNYVCWVDVKAVSTMYLDCFLVEDNDSVTVPEAPEAPEMAETLLPNISVSVSARSSLNLNFYIPAGVYNEDLTVVVKRNGIEIASSGYTVAPSGSRYCVTVPVQADDMSDVMSVQLFNSNGEPVTQERATSVRGVAMKLLDADMAISELRLLTAMLDYGTQAHLANYADPLYTTNGLITPEFRESLGTFEWPEATTEADSATGTAALSKFSASVSALETVTLNYYIKTADLGDYKIKVSLGDKVLTEGTDYTLAPNTTSDGTPRVRVSIPVNANKMCDIYTVQVVDADGNAIYEARSMSVRHCIGLSLSTMGALDKPCAIAMLDYGAYAQLAYNADDTDLANRYITAEDRAN